MLHFAECLDPTSDIGRCYSNPEQQMTQAFEQEPLKQLCPQVIWNIEWY